MNKKIAAVSLGCDKNRVDTENMLFLLTKAGYTLTQNPEEADYILVNTCGFIQKAKEESIQTVLEMSDYKRDGKKLIVTGCLAERYGKELYDGLPEADALVGVQSENNIVEIVRKLDGERVLEISSEYRKYVSGRVLTTPYHYAYLKIADGCDNRCSYCAIPYIRGAYRSTEMPLLIAEAKGLIEQGVKEIILVAQDTTLYGQDLYGRPMLKELLRRLAELDLWKIRILYAYPERVDRELVEIISKEKKIAKYIDIPLQHIDDAVLKRMNRKSKRQDIEDMLKMIKSIDEGIAIRTTFIAGFNSETQERYQSLKNFIADTQYIDYAGFFAYSPEEGTPAQNFTDDKVSKRQANARVRELERLWSQRTCGIQQKYVGKTVEVIYEGIDFDKQKLWGRTEHNAPEIDTRVYLEADFTLEIGTVYRAQIYKADFNLYGKIWERV